MLRSPSGRADWPRIRGRRYAAAAALGTLASARRSLSTSPRPWAVYPRARLSLGRHRHRLPLAPGRQPRFVVGGRDPQRRLAQEYPQRRLLRVDDGEDGFPGRGGHAGRRYPPSPLLRGLRADLGVGRQLVRVRGRRAGPVRVVPARLDQRDVDPEAGHLLGEGLAQPLQAPLRGVVCAHHRERRDPADRRDLDDVPAALLAQDWQRSLGDPQRAEEVRLELRPDVLLAELLHQAEVPVACVVHHDVEAAEVLVRLLYGGEVGLAVGHVQLDRQHGVAVGGYQGIQGRGVPGGGCYLVPAVQGGDGPFPAEPARCTSDKPDLATHQVPSVSSMPRLYVLAHSA